MQIAQVPMPEGARGRLSIAGKAAVAPDPAAALRHSGATTIVCLVEPHELVDQYPQYVEWLGDHRGDGTDDSAVWFPIADLHALSVPKAELLLADLLRRLARDQHLLVHCGAGIGRTGMIVACLLVSLGRTVEQALADVASVGAGPEVSAQRDLVEVIAARRDV